MVDFVFSAVLDKLVLDGWENRTYREIGASCSLLGFVWNFYFYGLDRKDRRFERVANLAGSKLVRWV
jgi:hypothetical protein